VEESLVSALCTSLRLAQRPTVVVAGRTDSGVHARGQVVHVDVPRGSWQGRDHDLLARLRGLLPTDVRVTSVQDAPEGFDARFSALWRRYSYTLCDRLGGVDPLRRRDVVAHRRWLDVERMNAAAQPLLGEHDFLAFCRPRHGASTIRELRELAWTREGELVVARVVADAFCHRMVRSLVGALVAVGEGRRAVAWPSEVLRVVARDPEVLVMPAHGLVLEAVGYPPDDLLAQRAEQARVFRGSAAGASEPAAQTGDPDDDHCGPA
jgi:tRNA pseudouridine38-40 synthase